MLSSHTHEASQTAIPQTSHIHILTPFSCVFLIFQHPYSIFIFLGGTLAFTEFIFLFLGDANISRIYTGTIISIQVFEIPFPAFTYFTFIHIISIQFHTFWGVCLALSFTSEFF